MHIFLSGGERQMVLLAPSNLPIPEALHGMQEKSTKHNRLLKESQKLRGRIMVEEGVLSAEELDPEKGYCSPIDETSWHTVIIDKEDHVVGCFRMTVHPSTIKLEQLNTWRQSRVRGDKWASLVKTALAPELKKARRHHFSMMELGGWVLSESLRGSSEALKMALTAYAWGQLAGGSFGVITATVQHGSSSILRRLGGTDLIAEGEPLPRYYDPEYHCEMEMLRFDSRKPNPRYATFIADVKEALTMVPIFLSGNVPLQAAA